jgi:hypothetical protein
MIRRMSAPERWAITFSSSFMRCWTCSRVVVFGLSSCFRADQVRWQQ